jgi:DNA invertase Pin-like site-specific DNA recombinase
MKNHTNGKNDEKMAKTTTNPDTKVEKKNKILNLIGYCRVSTSRQKDEETIEQQIDSIKKYIELHNEKFRLVDILTDDGISGFLDRTKRPGYNEALNKLKSEDIDGIISRDLSRIARKSKILLNFSDFLQNNNKELILIKQNIDTSTPTGRAFYGIMSTFVQWDAENTIERLQQGRAYAKANKKDFKLGRKKKEIPERLKNKIIFWYKNQKDGFHKISKLLLGENLKNYPKWFQEAYPNGFGKTTKMERKKGIKRFHLSPTTIGKHLKEWKIEIRDPKFRKPKKKKSDKNDLKLIKE